VGLKDGSRTSISQPGKVAHILAYGQETDALNSLGNAIGQFEFHDS